MSQNKKDIVFFSWQSDLDAKTNRNVIGDCIKIICKRNNLLYDEGTKDRCGSPDIARSIEEKIKSADIFIADVTIINAESQAKPTPNPNVLFELGIAQAIRILREWAKKCRQVHASFPNAPQPRSKESYIHFL